MSVPTPAESFDAFNALPPEVSHGSGVTDPEALPAQTPLISDYDGKYPDYLQKYLTPEELLGVAKWAKDAEARIEPCVAAYEQEQSKPRGALVASRAAELICRSAMELGNEAEARIWAKRAVGALTLGASSFDAVPGPEQEAISTRLEELKVDLAPQLQPLLPEA